MPIKDCIKKSKRADFAEKFNTLLDNGVNEFQAAEQIILEEQESLQTELNDIRKTAGLEAKSYKKNQLSDIKDIVSSYGTKIREKLFPKNEGDTNPQNRISFTDIELSENDNIDAAIDKLIDYGGEFTTILQFIKADPNLKNLKLQLVDSRRGLENGESGLYYPQGDTDGMGGTLQIANKDNVYYTATHELLHFFTLDSSVAEQVKESNSYKALEDMYNYIVSKKGKPVAISGGATVENYALTNVKEFMAEMLINPTFRNYVSDVFAENKEDILKASKAIKDTKSDSIVDIVFNLFKDLFEKIFSSNKKDLPFNESQSVIENAASIATDLFFQGKDVIAGQVSTADGGKVLDISSNETRAAALALPSASDKVIKDFVKTAFNDGASAEDIKTALIENGFSEKDATKIVEENSPAKEKKDSTGFENNKKSILSRIFESNNIPKYVKEKFENEGLEYNPQSHEVARKIATDIIDEFGVEDSITMAESGRFNGDVNSLIFAVGIDTIFEREKKATTAEGKQKLAEQWADYATRYDKIARDKGKFISAVYEFYRKSPLGIIIQEKAKREETFSQWFKNKEKPYKEVFEAIKDEPEMKELIKEEVELKTKEERAAARSKRRDQISSIFDSAKMKGDNLHSSLIPPPIWNGAMEIMKQAALAGESIVSVIESGIAYVKENNKEAFNEQELRKEWQSKFKGIDGNAKTVPKTTQQKVIDRFRKKLEGLSDSQKEDIIRRSFSTLIENGALEYDEFKKIVASVMGLGDLTAQEVEKINNYVKEINSVQDAADNVINERTGESIGKFRDAAKKAEKAATELSNIRNSKVDLTRRISSIIQLNTLGVVSLIKNPIYNVAYQLLVRFPKGVVLTGIDQTIYGISVLANKLFNSPVVKPDVNILLGQKGYFSKGSEGLSQSVNQVFTGLTNADYFQKEIRTSQIKPTTSWVDLWAWSKGEKFLNGKQIADKLIQGTVGVPAEAVARVLNIGDKPFRFAAEAIVAKTIAKTEFGVKEGIDMEIFMTFPKEEATRLYKNKGVSHEEAVRKAEAVEKRIISEGEAAVFQQENLLNRLITGLGNSMTQFSENNPEFKGVTNAGKLLGTLNMPFVKTPANLAWDLMNLAMPELALAQSALYGYMAANAKFNKDNVLAADYLLKSKKWAAHGAVGYSLLNIAGYLASIGAISGSDDEEKAKERKGKKTYQRPNSINLTKLLRGFTGESVEDEDNDFVVDLSYFGTVGTILNIQANRMENMTKEERDSASSISELYDRMKAASSEGLENSIFSNSIAGLNAIKQGGRWVNSWAMNTINVGSNFFQPATFAQHSRASLDYNPEIKADSFLTELKNNFSSRSSLFRLFAGYPPSAITIWGDKSMRNNTGLKGTIFNMLGVDEYNKDTFAEPIFQDFKRTGNSSFFPPDVMPKITIDGQSVKLNVEQERQLETFVGQARKSLLAPYVNNSATIESKDENINGKRYSELNDEQKVKVLNTLYKKAYDAGRSQLKVLYPQFQTQKDKEKSEN